MASAVSDLRALRETVARIERRGEGGRMNPAGGLVALGDGPLALDATLGGGLRCGTLHEIMAVSARDGPAAAAFAVALAARCAGSGAVVWIIDDQAALESGTPYRPGLAAHGLDPDALLLVKTRDAQSTLWATEEALRAGARVVLTELWRARAYDLAASRRLLLAARRRAATSLLVHVGVDAAAVSSAADTRFAVAAAPGERRVSAGSRTPIPGLAGFTVRLLKLRGTAQGLRGFDRDDAHTLVWDREARAFRNPQTHEPLWRVPPGPPAAGQPALFGQGGAA